MVTGIPARHISNPLTNKWGWMFQLWKIKQNFCWHFELIALKMSWPHLCCREIRDLQCTQVSHSGNRLIFLHKIESGKNIIFAGLSSRCILFPDPSRASRKLYLNVKIRLFSFAFLLRATRVQIRWKYVTTLHKRRSNPHLWALSYIELTSSSCDTSLSLSSFPFWQKCELNSTRVIICNLSSFVRASEPHRCNNVGSK